MIRRISISNYALIRQLTFTPSQGLNIITGETGAGKSIILGALALLQGKRADSKSISGTEEKSSVEAEVVYHDGSVHILRREILSSGRSKAFIDGKPVSIAELTEVSTPLLDIHSQHQNLQLTDPFFQLETLDHLAQNSDLLKEYHLAFAEYRAALKNFVTTRDEIKQTESDVDYLEFLLKEFEGLDLRADEDEELEMKVSRLRNANDIALSLKKVSHLISRGESAASGILSLAIEELRIASDLSEKYGPYLERLSSIMNELEFIAEEVDDEAEELIDEPASLGNLETLLNRINSLKSKHRVDNIEKLISVRDSIMARLDNFKNSETTLHDLEKVARRLKKSALEIATNLSERRKSAAVLLEQELMERARPLGMENLLVKINVLTGKLNPNGIDSVEYLFAFNKNQTLSPATNRASGGELSRVMLALKSITVEHQNTPTIIFDEIDTGVSGDVANRMGKLMKIIANHIQVITITHLPQIAARGDSHFKVYKRDDDTSTRTYVKELQADERRNEIAEMLSGNSTDPAALATADSLLKNN